MDKLIQHNSHPNDIPTILVRDTHGRITEKVSVNEWNRRKSSRIPLEVLEIKLYRQALDYYGNQELSKAVDLLSFLIRRTNYTHYEYVERLANIFHITNQFTLEIQLLERTAQILNFHPGDASLVKKIRRRIEKVRINHL